eukprot:TRINITY_DN22139_c0_g1_i2.p1 TRINITY_DN22139_c0_g1~~TRINITY_DN22139_c0_g1_i2.p1  ORF type:complete len:363 (-),score=69.00 TRINITY_DN22139_c0_g1_i2:197-1285(-)
MAVEDERFEAYLAAGKALSLLTQRSQTTLGLERGSVYGAAVALPQFARTSGWSLHYTAWAFRGYLFLVMNLTLQGFLIFMISKEERINDKFGGQMHLCDFGAHIENCPDTSNCVGPGGTVYTPDRLYNWEMWAIRVYVRDSLLKLFPHREAEVNLTVDPGEYGLESYNLRAMCCFIFLIGLWPDLIGSLNLLHLLFRVPTKDEPWILYEKPGYEDTDELSGLSLRIAGMPLGWKIANFVLVWVPKVYIWILTIDVGILFLMETAQIEDMVINAVSLAFILSLDELIFESMFNDAAKKMMESLEDFSEQPDDKTNATDMEVYEAHMRNRSCVLEDDGSNPFLFDDDLTRFFPCQVLLRALRSF